MPKDRVTRDIDRPAPIQIGSADLGVAPSYAPPALGSLDAPDGLSLATGLLRSASTPLAYISATWNRPDGSDPTEYVVQASTSGSFTTATTITYRAAQASATLDGLTHNTLYYVRVAAVYYARQSAWSDSASITTANDTTAPGVVSSLAGAFSAAGDLLLTWTLPTSANLKDCEVRIYASNGGTLLRTVYVTGSSYLYPAATNRADSGGTPDPSLYVLVRTRNWANTVSSDVSVSPSSTAPTAPSGVNVDFTAPDLLLRWTRQADAIAYRLTLDGTPRIVTDPFYRYPFALNLSEHPSGVGSAPAYVSTSGASFASGTSGSASLPGSLQDNDYVIAFVAVRGFASAVGTIVGNVTPPAGWDLLAAQPRETPSSQYWLAAYGRFVTAADSSASLSWGWAALAANHNLDIRYAVYRGVNTTTPVNATAGVAWTSASTTASSAVATTTLGNTRPVRAMLFLLSSSTATSSVSFGTERYDVSPSGPSNTLLHTAMDVSQASAGSTPAATFTSTISATGVGLTIALSPPTTGGAADPVIDYGLTALNGLDQESTATTGTATNAAPATVSISVTAYFNTLAISLGQSAAADVNRYRVRVYRDAGLIDTFYTTSLLTTYAATTSGSYTADVAVEDVFGQLSTVTTSSAATLDGLTIADLRANARYQDDLSTSPDTLKTRLSDNNNVDVIAYPGVGTWHWTEFARDLTDRYQTITLAVWNGATASAQGYVAVSNDGVTWTYFSGPLTSGRILTAVASQAAAQTAAITFTAGGALTRYDLPTIQDVRYLRVYHRNNGSGTTYSLAEYYPRRLVQSDDIQAEAIKAINIAAASITADRLSVSSLSAISANLGTITAGTITGTTITGGTIRTAASGARAELTSAGLRTYDSSGNVQVEATTTTDGALRFGAGAGQADRTGLRLNSVVTVSSPPETSMLRWDYSGTRQSYIGGWNVGAGISNFLDLAAENGSGLALVQLRANNDNSTEATIDADTITLAGAVDTGGGALSAGALTTSAAITAKIRDAGTTNRTTNLFLDHNTSGTPGALFGVEIALRGESTTTEDRDLATLSARWTVATDASRRSELAFFTYDASSFRQPLILGTTGSAASIGFLGAAPVARPTITGSRGGNAALASLLTALATLGLVTDSTT